MIFPQDPNEAAIFAWYSSLCDTTPVFLGLATAEVFHIWTGIYFPGKSQKVILIGRFKFIEFLMELNLNVTTPFPCVK